MVSSNCIKPKILIIAGPTAVGKTLASLKFAKEFNGEIISADSMQVYRGLNIGTAKLKKEEMLQVPHYLIDIKNPDESYSVSEFVLDASERISEITNRGKLPIIVGGTGLYINALINGFTFCQSGKSEEFRDKMEEVVLKEGLKALYEQLCEVDYESAKKISPNDKIRIIRALEVYNLSGRTKSELTDVGNTSPEYNYLFFVIDDERNRIYDRINTRVDKMFKDGLIDEVRGLIKYKNCQSMQAIGYKEVVEHIVSNTDYNFMLNRIKQNTRHYAKRQQTYFKWMKAEKMWVNISEIEKHFDTVACFKQ